MLSGKNRIATKDRHMYQKVLAMDLHEKNIIKTNIQGRIQNVLNEFQIEHKDEYLFEWIE